MAWLLGHRRALIAANVAKLPELGAKLMRGLPTSSAQWIWSQFTLADHAFVWLSKALYLILKFAVVHRQSFDDDIRSLPHIQACRKQTRTNLEFMHDARRTISLYAPNWGQVYAKGTATSHVLGRGFSHVTCADISPREQRQILAPAPTRSPIAAQCSRKQSLRERTRRDLKVELKITN